MPKVTPAIEISPAMARAFLVGHHGLRRIAHEGRAGAVAVLNELRCIQLDPLDVLGTNADLVVLARVDGIRRGDVYEAVFPGHAFEHFAKERCLLPAHHFPYYRAQAAETPWWRLSERKRRISPKVLRLVLDEVREKGPVSARALTHRGKVEPLDWNGWKGTSSATAMALEVLWTQCKVVVCGRRGGAKLYDVPERALPQHASGPAGGFARWALLERVEAAGLLSRNAGPHWSMLSSVRGSSLPDELIAEGRLKEVRVSGSPRRYLASANFLERTHPVSDGRVRLLGPLDPLLWDRSLVKAAFDFDYVWEVYKPASQRRWGWYVLPLLHHDRLVGRLEGLIEKDRLVVRKLWEEPAARLSRIALREALRRHARACGVDKVSLPTRA